MIRQGHFIAVGIYFLIGCAVLLMVVGCAWVRSEASKQEEQGHTEATREQARSDRCNGTRTFRIKAWGVFTTNDVPGCPKGGLLSGTDGRDKLDGEDGDDEVRGLGDKDGLNGGNGADIIYGGPGDDGLRGDTVDNDVGDDGSKDVLYGGPGKDWIDGAKGDDVIYGGEGDDEILWGGAGEDVIYGGDGNDILDPAPRGDGDRDKLYCGKGRDRYNADKLDYVDSSCEKEAEPPPGPPGALADSPDPNGPLGS